MCTEYGLSIVAGSGEYRNEFPSLKLPMSLGERNNHSVAINAMLSALQIYFVRFQQVCEVLNTPASQMRKNGTSQGTNLTSKVGKFSRDKLPPNNNVQAVTTAKSRELARHPMGTSGRLCQATDRNPCSTYIGSSEEGPLPLPLSVSSAIH